MRRYETVLIIDPDVAEEQRGSLFGRLDEIIDQKNGLLILNDEWGVRKLAYPIKKRVRGDYVRMEYCGDGGLVDEIERFFRIDDRALKYMTVVLDKNADLEKVKQEIADAAEAKEKAEAARKAAAKAAAAPPAPVVEEAAAPVAEAAEAAETPEPAEPAEPAAEASTDSTDDKEEA